MQPTKVSAALLCACALCDVCPLPNNFIDELILAENLVEHHLYVVAGVPVAVIVEAAGFLEHPCEFDAARPHEVDVCLGRFMTVLKRAFLFGLAPEHFVVSIGVERRIDIDQIDTAVRQLAKAVPDYRRNK